ncbi:MAG TPA: H(+)/Cl(-) exchange transporter ClcA [Terriglobales bacterium]|nr:H(+)/Cl(-) exchange transporter ClcA [Terriglobales bacterium]
MATDPDRSQAKPSATVEAKSEIQEYLEVSHQRHKLFPRAAVVGLCAGGIAVVFRALLAGGDALRNGLIAWSTTVPIFGWLFPMLFSAAGALLAAALVFYYAPETSGSGIPHLKAVLHRLRDLTWTRVLSVKMASGVLAISSGLALGREGPTVQMGGAIADGISRLMKVSPSDRLTLTAAGAGAGLAAAFNAPLSGLVFVLEEVQRDFRPAVFGAAFVAAASADVVARSVSGQLPVFTVPSYAMPPLQALPAFALLGIVAGFFGVLFNRSLVDVLDLMARTTRRWNLVIGAAVGAAVGLVAWFNPLAVGGGHELAESVLIGKTSIVAIPVLFVLRFAMTVTSYGTGAAGGIFAPLLALGALLGLGFGHAVHYVTPAVTTEPALFAVVGMAAYFTAIVRAPLTGILLITEMTGSYEQMLPLLASSFCAYAVAELLRSLPIYEALLERDLKRGGIGNTHAEPIVVEFEVEPRAPFAGKAVRELGLPGGCVLVRSYALGREWVPTASTRLEPHMRITAVIAPEAEGALEALRAGCAASE